MTAPLAPRIKALPVVGALPQMISDFPHVLHDMVPPYGDVVRIPVLNSDIYVVSNPADIQYMLRDNHKNFARGGAGSGFLTRIIGRGLIVLEGEEWLTERRMMQPYFHRKYFPALIETMAKAVDELLDELDTELTDEVMDFVPFIKRLTMTVFLRAMFSMGLDKERVNKFGKAVDKSMRLASNRDRLSAFIPMSIKLPMDKKIEQDVGYMNQLTADIIAKRRELAEQPADLLGFLIDATDPDSGIGMNDKQLLDECKTLIIAGYDTTSGTLMWLLQLLQDRPDIAAKLVAEADQVFSTPITMERISELEVSRQTVMETLRLRPAAWANTRMSVADDTLGGYHIPGGVMVMFPVMSIQKDPRWWGEDAAEFKPERWQDKNGGAKHNWAFLAFGGGPRVCLGESFAILEATMVAPKLVQRFEITPVNAEVKKVNYAFTMQPVEMPVRIKRRQPTATQASAPVTTSAPAVEPA